MRKILLVEDNDLNQKLTFHWLTRWGYEVTIAADGEEAISKGQSDKPDLILMDLGLPKIDGWEATRRLKADVETRRIPIVAVTGYAVKGDRHKALAAGCDAYCAKPVNFEQLHAIIEAHLHRVA